MPNKITKKPNPTNLETAASTIGQKGVEARMNRFTAEQRSQQARAAVMARYHQGPWLALLVSSKTGAGEVTLAWLSKDRSELEAMAKTVPYKHCRTFIAEQGWPNDTFKVVRKLSPPQPTTNI
jgi:hypothetical protein